MSLDVAAPSLNDPATSRSKLCSTSPAYTAYSWVPMRHQAQRSRTCGSGLR